MFRLRPNAELSPATLRAIRFAQLARHLISGVVLRLFRKQVSSGDAQAALDFFSSPAGRAIAAKLVKPEIPKLTAAEEAAPSQFKSSPQGAALERFLGDPRILPAITEAIMTHAR